MNVGWNLVAGTASRYLLLAVNVCLGIFLMPYTVLAAIGSATRRAAATPATI